MRPTGNELCRLTYCVCSYVCHGFVAELFNLHFPVNISHAHEWTAGLGSKVLV